MATLARTDMLERKIDKHMREHANEMKTFRNELHILKMKPRATPTTSNTAKDQRTLNDGNKKPAHNLKAELARNKITSAKPLKKIHNDHGESTNNYSAATAAAMAGGDKMSNNNVNKTVSAEKEILPSNSSHTSTLSLSLSLYRICNIIIIIIQVTMST